MTSTTTPRLTKRLVPAVALGAALLSFGKYAHAQDAASPDRFGQKGQFAVTAEDLTGVYSDRVGWKEPDGDHSVSNTRFSLLFTTHGGGRNIVTVPASTIGFHYFIIDGLSLGGNLGYESRSGSVQEPAGRAGVVSQPLGTGSTFIFEPKVGYALALSDVLGFWFRGGLSVAVDSEYPNAGDKITEDKFTYWMLSANVLFTIMPVDHFGFYVGPGLDISFTGTYTRTDVNRGVPVSTSYGSSYRRFKFGAGMIAYF